MLIEFTLVYDLKYTLSLDSTFRPLGVKWTKSALSPYKLTMTTDSQVASVPLNTIHVTPRAAEKAREFSLKEGREQCRIKIAVQGGGCSGLQYVLELVDGPEDSDKVIMDHGIEVYVPKRAFVFLAGTVLDFSDGLNGRGFEFQNPNAKRTCGCGDSFAV